MQGAGRHQPLTQHHPHPAHRKHLNRALEEEETGVLLTDERAQGQVQDEQEPMQSNKIGIQGKGPSIFSKFSSRRFLVSPQSLLNS